MSENSTPEERTEQPTDRRMGQLRKDGAIFFSTEIVQVLSLFTGFYMLTLNWSALYTKFQYVLVRSYMLIEKPEPLSTVEMHSGFLGLIRLMLPNILAIVVAVSIISSLAVMLQTGWNVKGKKIDFKLGNLNPISGLKKIFSIQGFITTGKALIKLAVILPVAYYALKSMAPKMIMLVHLNVEAILAFTGASMHALFWKILYILIAMALFDYFYGKFQWFKTNKMTKEEVKDERKSTEGDEATKRKIVNKGIQRIIQRIKTSVPQADVVVTNPTHYSVALKYDRKNMGAPIVVAKGQGFLALRIREIAKESNVPVLERKWLARSLYASTEVGAEIPHDLFKAVAEVLAYVYRLKNPWGYMQHSKR